MQVCHGVPSDTRHLRRGDIVNVDVTVITPTGWHGDTSMMWHVGHAALLESSNTATLDPARRLALVTRECLFLGLQQVAPGVRLGRVGEAISEHARRHGYSVVVLFQGHGIGKAFHEAPFVQHSDRAPRERNKARLLELREGMVFTIEPMLNGGGPDVAFRRDGWTAVTADGSLSAQWEHTVSVTRTGYEILTLREGEEPPEITLLENSPLEVGASR